MYWANLVHLVYIRQVFAYVACWGLGTTPPRHTRRGTVINVCVRVPAAFTLLVLQSRFRDYLLRM